MTYVCPGKDIVCGSWPENWCKSCPLRAPAGMSEPDDEQIDDLIARSSLPLVSYGENYWDVDGLIRKVDMRELIRRGIEAANPSEPWPNAGVLTPPPHPESQTMTWSALELAAIRAYGERCWAAGRSCAPAVVPEPALTLKRSGPSPNSPGWTTFNVRTEDADEAEARLRSRAPAMREPAPSSVDPLTPSRVSRDAP